MPLTSSEANPLTGARDKDQLLVQGFAAKSHMTSPLCYVQMEEAFSCPPALLFSPAFPLQLEQEQICSMSCGMIRKIDNFLYTLAKSGRFAP